MDFQYACIYWKYLFDGWHIINRFERSWEVESGRCGTLSFWPRCKLSHHPVLWPKLDRVTRLRLVNARLAHIHVFVPFGVSKFPRLIFPVWPPLKIIPSDLIMHLGAHLWCISNFGFLSSFWGLYFPYNSGRNNRIENTNYVFSTQHLISSL